MSSLISCPAGATHSERWVSCEIPRCANQMLYAGRGRRRSTAMDGGRHTRLTAHRLTKGQITLPAPGGRTQMTADTKQRRGEDNYSDQARPVTAARMTLQLLLGGCS